MPALIDILRDVPFIDFDKSLSWEGIVVRKLTFLVS